MERGGSFRAATCSSACSSVTGSWFFTIGRRSVDPCSSGLESGGRGTEASRVVTGSPFLES